MKVYISRDKKVDKNELIDVLATKLAEIRLSELGYRFIPGIALSFTRAKKFIEAKAVIVKKDSLIISDGTKDKNKQI